MMNMKLDKNVGEVTQNKKVLRGRGVEQLDRLRMQQWKNKMTPGSPFIPFVPFTTPYAYAGVPNSGPICPPHFQEMFQPFGIHGSNPFAPHGTTDPSKELSSIPNNYVNCGHKIDGGGDTCLMNQFRNVYRDNTGLEAMDAGKTCRGVQVSEGISVQGKGGSPMAEYEYFPGKDGSGGGSGECCGLITSIRRLFYGVFRKSDSKKASQSYGVVRLLEEY